MDHPLTALAEAVADRQVIDWNQVDVSAFDPLQRTRLEALRAVSAIADCLGTASLSSFETGLSAAANAADAGALARWGGLTIREHVGRGRFGDVFRAWDPTIERDVALKLLREPIEDEPGGPIVIHEARLMARVRHPNVATIYGAARHDGRTGLWMEFIEGRTLQAEVRASGPMPADDAIRTGIDLCRALGAVHGAGLVHRDVKAQNVLRDRTGRVVLGDFGTGVELDESAADAPLAGTPLYVAPELWQGAPATVASDLYSLGALLFYLVTGRFPIEGRSTGEIKRAHETGTHSRVTDLRPELPTAFAAVIERALSADPRARYTTAAEMEAALAAIVAPPLAPKGGNPGLRRVAAVAGAALLVLGGIGFTLTPLGDRLRSAWPSAADRRRAEPRDTTRRLSKVPAPDAQFWGRPGPDARWFSFVDMSGDLGLFDVTSGQTRILTDRKTTGGSAFESSTFSPDGARIAYAWENAEGVRELRIIDVNTLVSQVIWHAADEIPHPVDWSQGRDRLLVLFARQDGRRRLGVISSSGADLTELTAVRAGLTAARLSRDGERVVFDDLQAPDDPERDVFMLNVSQPTAVRKVVATARDEFAPLWADDGKRLVFISDRTGEPSVWSVDVERDTVGQPAILHRNIGRILPNGLGRDGTLYYTLQVGVADIYEATLDPGPGPGALRARPLAAAEVGAKVNSQWSSGGKLVYVALPLGNSGPHIRRLAIVDPGAPPRLLNLPLSYYLIPRWSPDGRTILLKGIDLEGRHGLFLVDTMSGTMRTATLCAPEEIGPFQWGADSRTILYTRQRVGLFARDITTGLERKVFDFASEGINGLVASPGFRVSRDGRSIAYTATRRNAANQNETVLRVKHGTSASLDLVLGRASVQDWTPSGDVVFTRPEKDRLNSAWRVPSTGGPAVSLDLSMLGLRNLSVDRDGRRVTFTAGYPGSDVWALANFLPPAGSRR
jgi:serine/threonine protein kinase